MKYWMHWWNPIFRRLPFALLSHFIPATVCSVSTQFCVYFFSISNFAHAFFIISKLHELSFVATAVLQFCVTSNVPGGHTLPRQESMFTQPDSFDGYAPDFKVIQSRRHWRSVKSAAHLDLLEDTVF
jgi:hypothetical protein